MCQVESEKAENRNIPFLESLKISWPFKEDTKKQTVFMNSS